MIEILQETTIDQEKIIQEYADKGCALAAIKDHRDGHWLVFREPTDPVPEKKPSTVDLLKAQVVELATKVAELQAGRDKNASDIAELTAKVAEISPAEAEAKL